MIFEFTIVYQREQGVSILAILLERLRTVLTDNLNEFDDEETARMLAVNFERRGAAVTDDAGVTRQRTVLGFTLELADETSSARTVVDEFADVLVDAPIEHAVKFEDPMLQQELAQRAEELFALEMKLRRVLSVVYLHAYQEGDPYDLLRDEAVQPTAKEPPKPEQMKAAAENQFFHLVFSQYIGLNKRREPKLPDLFEMVRAAKNFESLHAEMIRAAVEDEDDSVLLAGLKGRLDAIEAMRNCVAHSRRPSKHIVENYDNAKPLLDQLLNDCLSRWAWKEPETHWEKARYVVESALEQADWDETTKTITFYDPYRERIDKSVNNREQLEDYLRKAASNVFFWLKAFSAKAPRDDGEYGFECDEDRVIESVLVDYEDRLEALFRGGKPAEAE